MSHEEQIYQVMSAEVQDDSDKIMEKLLIERKQKMIKKLISDVKEPSKFQIFITTTTSLPDMIKSCKVRPIEEVKNDLFGIRENIMLEMGSYLLITEHGVFQTDDIVIFNYYKSITNKKAEIEYAAEVKQGFVKLNMIIVASVNDKFHLDCLVHDSKEFYNCKALFDTGAQPTCFNCRIGELVGQSTLRVADNSESKKDRYVAHLKIEGVLDREVMYVNLPSDIIGMNIIKDLDVRMKGNQLVIN